MNQESVGFTILRSSVAEMVASKSAARFIRGVAREANRIGQEGRRIVEMESQQVDGRGFEVVLTHANERRKVPHDPSRTVPRGQQEDLEMIRKANELGLAGVALATIQPLTMDPKVRYRLVGMDE